MDTTHHNGDCSPSALFTHYCYFLDFNAVVEVETDSSDEVDDEMDNATNETYKECISGTEKPKTRANSIDSQSRVSSGSVHGVSRCVMCGKEFQHNANLRIHLQSHLGTKAQLKSCEKCDR